MTVKAMYLCNSSHGLCHLITHKDMKHGQVKKVLQEVGDGWQTYQFHFINIRCHCFFFGHFSKRIPGVPITINTSIKQIKASKRRKHALLYNFIRWNTEQNVMCQQKCVWRPLCQFQFSAESIWKDYLRTPTNLLTLDHRHWKIH